MVRPASTTDDATPNPNGIAAQNLIRLAALTGDHALARPGRPADRGRAGGAGDNLCPHAALLNALDLRLQRRGDRRDRPGRTRASPPPRCKLPYLNRDRAARAVGAGACRRNHPAQAKIAVGTGERGVRLRRRDLLAAGDRSGQDRRRGRPRCGRRVALKERSAHIRRCSLRGTAAARRGRTCARDGLGALLLRARLGPCRRRSGRAAAAAGAGLLGCSASMREPPPHSTGIQAATYLRASFSVLLSASVVRRNFTNLLFHEVTQRKPSWGLAPSRVRWNAAHWKRVRLAASSMVKLRRR